jgi:tagatose-1,6-bisphosphate aldolase non-catalytic subunit AgaZ/GatZ
MKKTAQQKRSSIIKYLETKDPDFKKTCEDLMARSDDHLDPILKDIALYSSSKMALKEARYDLVLSRFDVWHCPLWITLTFRYPINSRRKADALFESFDQQLGYCIFKKAHRRHNKRCESIVVCEGDVNASTHLHYHGIFELPRLESVASFSERVNTFWPHGNVCIKVIGQHPNDRAIISAYLLKQRTKYAEEVFVRF